MSDWLDQLIGVADTLLGPLDEMGAAVFNAGADIVGDLLFSDGADDTGLIPTGLFGLGGVGWEQKKITKYVKGERTQAMVWYKPYKSMTELEKRAYFQGQRVQGYDGRKRANASYKRGFNSGAKAQSIHEKQLESGVTPPIRWIGRR